MRAMVSDSFYVCCAPRPTRDRYGPLSQEHGIAAVPRVDEEF